MVAQKRRGIEAQSLNRFMRLPHADLILAAIAAGLSVAILVSFSGIDFAIKTNGVLPALFAAIFGVDNW